MKITDLINHLQRHAEKTPCVLVVIRQGSLLLPIDGFITSNGQLELSASEVREDYTGVSNAPSCPTCGSQCVMVAVGEDDPQQPELAVFFQKFGAARTKKQTDLVARLKDFAAGPTPFSSSPAEHKALGDLRALASKLFFYQSTPQRSCGHFDEMLKEYGCANISSLAPEQAEELLARLQAIESFDPSKEIGDSTEQP